MSGSLERDNHWASTETRDSEEKSQDLSRGNIGNAAKSHLRKKVKANL